MRGCTSSSSRSSRASASSALSSISTRPPGTTQKPILAAVCSRTLLSRQITPPTRKLKRASFLSKTITVEGYDYDERSTANRASTKTSGATRPFSESSTKLNPVAAHLQFPSAKTVLHHQRQKPRATCGNPSGLSVRRCSALAVFLSRPQTVVCRRGCQMAALYAAPWVFPSSTSARTSVFAIAYSPGEGVAVQWPTRAALS
jgi:hypothetical protein